MTNFYETVIFDNIEEYKQELKEEKRLFDLYSLRLYYLNTNNPALYLIKEYTKYDEIEINSEFVNLYDYYKSHFQKKINEHIENIEILEYRIKDITGSII